MGSADWLVVPPKPVTQLHFLSMGSGTLSVSATVGTSWLVRDGKKSFQTQHLLSAVP